MGPKVYKLGVISAMVFGTVAPSDKRLLWYDESIMQGCPIKYYNKTTNKWTLLVRVV